MSSVWSDRTGRQTDEENMVTAAEKRMLENNSPKIGEEAGRDEVLSSQTHEEQL